MRTILRKYMIATISIFLVSQSGLGLSVENNFKNFLFAGAVLFIILMIKPLIDTILFPIHLITLNLTNWIIHFILIYLWTLITPQVKFISFAITGYRSNLFTINPTNIPYGFSVILMSFILILTIKVFNWVFK